MYKIRERWFYCSGNLLGFIETPSTTCESLYKQLCNSLCALGLSLDQCRGQGYDDAANMISCLKGLATRVSADFPLATFNYCGGHMLNLVQDASSEPHTLKALEIACCCELCKGFSKTWSLFFCVWKTGRIQWFNGFKTLCHTRWVCIEPALKSFVQNYEKLLQRSFNSLTNFKTFFSINLLNKIFSLVHWTHLAIQKPTLNITQCTEIIHKLLLIL